MHLPNGDVFPFGTCHIIIAAGAESGHIANLAGMGVGKVMFFFIKTKKNCIFFGTVNSRFKKDLKLQIRLHIRHYFRTTGFYIHT